jgi:hypothetical protein
MTADAMPCGGRSHRDGRPQATPVSDGGPPHDTPFRTGAELEVRLAIVPLPDEAGGSVRDRQLAAIVRLLRSASEPHTPATPARDQRA